MGNYDRYPETRVTGHDGDAWEGAKAVASKLAELSALSDHTLVVECYPGVDDEVLELVRFAFKPNVVVLSDDVFDTIMRIEPKKTSMLGRLLGKNLNGYPAIDTEISDVSMKKLKGLDTYNFFITVHETAINNVIKKKYNI